MADLTTTSYAILGVLSIRPHSAYDLTQQARRSLRFVWPTSESQLYAEPKRLAAEGLIRITDEQAAGSRTRKVYRISASGRRALRTWLDTPAEVPHIESEVLLRAMFADAADKRTFLAALETCRARTLDEYDIGRAFIAEYADGDGPYPERMHMNVLWWVFMFEFFELARDWFQFAANEAQTWSDDTTPRTAARSKALVDRILAGDRILTR